mgnify:CR=1 FL=1
MRGTVAIAAVWLCGCQPVASLGSGLPARQPVASACSAAADCPALDVCQPCGDGCAQPRCVRGDCALACEATLDGGPCATDADCPQANGCPLCEEGHCAAVTCVSGLCEFRCAPPAAPAVLPRPCAVDAECLPSSSCVPCHDGECAAAACVRGECVSTCTTAVVEPTPCTRDSDCEPAAACLPCAGGHCAWAACVRQECALVCGR